MLGMLGGVGGGQGSCSGFDAESQVLPLWAQGRVGLSGSWERRTEGAGGGSAGGASSDSDMPGDLCLLLAKLALDSNAAVRGALSPAWQARFSPPVATPPAAAAAAAVEEKAEEMAEAVEG